MNSFGDLENISAKEAVGYLRVHEERLKAPSEPGGNKLLLTEEEWLRKEKDEGKLLLTREEWLRRSNQNIRFSGGNIRSRDGNRGGRDKSKVRCFNSLAYCHYAGEC